MAVDFGILAQTPSIGARYAEGLQLAQAEQERNMLRAMQIQQMDMQKKNMLAQDEERKAMAQQRAQQALKLKADMDRAARNEKLLAGLGDVLRKNGYKMDRPTLGHMAEVSLQTGDEAGAKLAMEGLRALDERDALQAVFGGQAASAAAPSMMRQPPAAAAPAAAPTNMFAGTPFDIGTTQPAPVNALAAPPQAPAAAPAAGAGGMSRERLTAIILDPNAPKAAVERAKAVLASLPKPDTYTPASEIQQYNLAVEQGFKGTIFDFKRKLAEAGRAPREPKGPGTPVAVVDDATGRVKYVSAEEAIGKTPASAMEGLSPKEIQKREAAHPQATSSVKSFTAKSEQFIKELEKLRDDPGLDSITGTIYGVTPGVISGEAGRRAMAQYNKIFAKGGFQALQDLKAASQTGGALGNVSNEEGRRLEASTVGGLDRSQSLDDVKRGINDFIAEIRGSMQRVREAYDDTYEYRKTRGAGSAGGAPPPRPPAGLSPEDKQALDWANSNPKDPRAAQIKQRLGM